MRTFRFAAIIITVMAGSTPVSTTWQAQETEASVSLDVVVTDARSRPVQNLMPADFELVDSGEPRPVEHAQLHSNGSRVLAIFLDEYHVLPGESSARARAALTAFVNTQLRPDDTIAIMRPLESLNTIAFADDRNSIRDAIAAFEGRQGDYTSRSTFEKNIISRDPKTAAAARAQVVTSALQALAARLGQKGSGRKTLVLVSEGYAPAMPRSVIDTANRGGVAIYPIDPHPEAGPYEPMLQMLAEQTGGYASINQTDLMTVLAQSVADLDGYYLISYPRARHADGKFHPVQVRVNRAGTQTRARTGYWSAGPTSAARASARTDKPMRPFRPSHASPYIRPWIGMSRGLNGLTRVTVAVEPGSAPPRNQFVSSIAVKAMGPDGEVLFQHSLTVGSAGAATFDAPPGTIGLELAVRSSTGATLDTDYRGISVPNLQVTKPTFATPQVLRTRTARDFAETSANATASPVASRAFSRTERLLVRVTAYGPADTIPTVTATLLNSRGTPMRALPRVPADLPGGFAQFDLVLSPLAPGEYGVELAAANPSGPRDEAREILLFRVTH